LVSDKKKRFQQTLWDLQHRWGQPAVRVLGQHSRSDACVPTGFPELDAALSSGGIPSGRITELIGIPTSGATTLTHKIIACGQQNDATAAYIDLTGRLDVDYAVRCGVVLDRLLIVRPHNPARALDIARDLFKESQCSVVVVDLAADDPTTVSLSAADTTLRRLNETVVKTRIAALFLLTPDVYTAWNALDHYSHTRLQVERKEWLYQKRDVRGYLAQITIAKDKTAAGSKQVNIAITFDDVVKGDSA
jgi:RecA/RadA recombinase